jgi:exopolysaccharide biosynthesis polyprenyl glycosylphosphotransferase
VHADRRPGAARRAAGQELAVLIRLRRFVDVGTALALILGVFVGTNLGRMPNGLGEFLAARLTVTNVLMLTAFAWLWRMVYTWFGLYDPRRIARVPEELVRAGAACTVGSAVTLAFPAMSVSGAFQYTTVMAFYLGTLTVTLLMRYALACLAEPPQAVGERRVLVVGTGPHALRVVRELRAQPGARCRLVGFVDSGTCATDDAVRRRTLGTLDQLDDLLMHRVVDEVMIALPVKSHYSEIQRAIDTCERVGVPARYAADFFTHVVGQLRYDGHDPMAMVRMDVAPNDYRLRIKRMIDVVGAAVGLAAFAPVLLLVAVAVKLMSPGPLIFAQERFGLRKRLFRMYKFRTMVDGADQLQATLEGANEAEGPVFKIRKDPRITRVGAWLRRTSMDELPQLVNVLRGDMSLVGPRPMATRDVGRFAESWLMRRFSVPPGITGLWQISGRSNLSFDDWIALDLQYIDGWSLGLDFRILARTIPVVLKGTGAA